MCGICGIIYKDKDKAVDNNMLTAMRDTLLHRGPDDAGNFIDKNVGLAARRLSIIDIAGGRQPIHNEDQAVWIVFNGEIYNYLELRHLLENKGHKFYTNSDTETIVHLYEEYGQDCLKHLRGMFAFAIWDSRNKIIFLARDRLGIKPLYYANKNGNLIFSSELKGILKTGLVSRDIDTSALSCYFTYGYIPAPYSIFQDIRKLAPANSLLWQDGRIQIYKYWDLDYQDKLTLSEDDICLRLEELLSEAVGSHLESEVPLGAFLSGGMDSSTVVSFMKDNSKQAIKTFSVGFDIKTHNELNYADMVSRHLGVENIKFMATAKTVNILSKLLWHLDEPFADTSIIPTYLLCKLTKDYVTVALSGDGGDEVFAGYSWMSKYSISQHLIPFFLKRFLYKLLIQDKSNLQYKAGCFSKFGRLVLDANLSLGDGFLRRTTFDKEIMDRVLLIKNRDFDPRDIQRDHFAKAKTKDVREKMLYVDTAMYLPGVCLFKVDRMSMANSLEVRVPFLDHKLVEFAAKIPFDLKLKGRTTKYILKKTMASRLSPKTLTKPKWGFSVPIDSWLRQDLADFTQDLLLDDKTKDRGIFNLDIIKDLLLKHKSEKFNLGYIIWSLVIFEIWARVYLDEGFDAKR